MPVRERSRSAIRDVLFVVVVAAAGLGLGAMVAVFPEVTPASAPVDPLLMHGTAEVQNPIRSFRLFPGTPASTDRGRAQASRLTHFLPPVFPYSGQPASGRQVDLREELARMAAHQHHLSGN